MQYILQLNKSKERIRSVDKKNIVNSWPIHKLKKLVVSSTFDTDAWEDIMSIHSMTLLTGYNNSLIYAVA